MPWSNYAHAPQLLNPCASTREPMSADYRAHTPQVEGSLLEPHLRLNAAKNTYIHECRVTKRSLLAQLQELSLLGVSWDLQFPKIPLRSRKLYLRKLLHTHSMKLGFLWCAFPTMSRFGFQPSPPSTERGICLSISSGDFLLLCSNQMFLTDSLSILGGGETGSTQLCVLQGLTFMIENAGPQCPGLRSSKGQVLATEKSSLSKLFYLWCTWKVCFKTQRIWLLYYLRCASTVTTDAVTCLEGQ